MLICISFFFLVFLVIFLILLFCSKKKKQSEKIHFEVDLFKLFKAVFDYESNKNDNPKT